MCGNEKSFDMCYPRFDRDENLKTVSILKSVKRRRRSAEIYVTFLDKSFIILRFGELMDLSC